MKSKDAPRECRLCLREGNQPPGMALSLVSGKRYSYAAERYVPYRGWLCEFHLCEEIKDLRYIRTVPYPSADGMA